ncbi:MAG: hypothetical protein Q7R97_01745 [Candidatus Daviesbacteria bacterium]|nr:hypothetical protein [Candidatus Daviesbacteria bacterium]
MPERKLQPIKAHVITDADWKRMEREDRLRRENIIADKIMAEKSRRKSQATEAFEGNNKLAEAFFNYAVDPNIIIESMQSGYRERVAERREVFVEALADLLLSGNSEDLVTGLNAAFGAIDNKIEVLAQSIYRVSRKGLPYA